MNKNIVERLQGLLDEPVSFCIGQADLRDTIQIIETLLQENDELFLLYRKEVDENDALRAKIKNFLEADNHFSGGIPINDWRQVNQNYLVAKKELQDSITLGDEYMLPDKSREMTLAQQLRVLYCTNDDLEPCGTCLTCRAAERIESLESTGDDIVSAIQNHYLTQEHLEAWEAARGE